MGSFCSTLNGEEGEHPLLNHVILENLFQFVRKRDLLACRGVCKKWNVMAIPLTRSKFTVGVHLSNESLDYYRNPSKKREIQNFVEIFSKNTLGIPFAKFNLGPFCTREGAGQQFLSLCGDTTTELHLCVKVENEVFEVEDLSELLRSMEKLEKLRMSDKLVTNSGKNVELFPGSKPKLISLKRFTLDTYPFEDDPIDWCPTFIEELIEAAGNISDIAIEHPCLGSDDKIDEIDEVDGIDEIGFYGIFGGIFNGIAGIFAGFDENDGNLDEFVAALNGLNGNNGIFDGFDGINLVQEIAGNTHSNNLQFQTLSAIEKLGRESFIETLSLDGIRMKPHVELLRRMTAKPNGLKLKGLSFSMDEDEVESYHFELVELHKDTLEDLSLSEFDSSSSSFLNFPKMPKLRRLKWNISSDFNSDLVDLNKIFPILEKLELSQPHGVQVQDEFIPQSEPCPNVKALWLLSQLHLSINAFDHILTVFPSLTELRIDIQLDGIDILRQIWNRMTQLESLSISGCLQTMESMDSLFTGISDQTIQRITGDLKNLGKRTVQRRRDTIMNLRSQHCQLPSIGNLTNLRWLKLNVSGNGDGSQSSYLSDVSGLLGFYSLKHLGHLFILKCGLTKTCCEILAIEMDVGLESWTFITPYRGKAIIPHSSY